MKNFNHLFTFALMISGLVLVSCRQAPDPSANFVIALDDNVRGKINVTNRSSDAENYFWELWQVQPDGTRSISSQYQNSVSTATNASFFVLENGRFEVVLTAINEDNVEDEHRELIEVTNVPSKMTIEKLVITYVSLVNEDGYEWDDLDWTTYDYTYQYPEEYPDLLANNNPFDQNKTYDDDLTYWDVDIENGLPFTMDNIEKTVYESFTFQTDEYYIELVDIDGTPNWMGVLGGEQIGVVTVNPYHLTHEYNGGEDGNYPDVYILNDDMFTAELHMKWE